MKTRIATLAVLTIVTLGNFAAAQTYTSHKSEWSKEWQSSWSTGPNGTHVSGDSKSTSSSTSTVGGPGGSRTISQSQSDEQGFARGVDSHGYYGSDYARQQGSASQTDVATDYYGRPVAIDQRKASYDNSQGSSFTDDGYGTRFVSAFDHQSGELSRRQAAVGRDMYGNRVVVGGSHTVGFNQQNGMTMGNGSMTASGSLSTYGRRTGRLMFP